MQAHGNAPHSSQDKLWRWVQALLGVLILFRDGLEAWEYFLELLISIIGG